MFASHSTALVPEVPTIDLSEAQWAAAELTALIQKLGPDSPVSMVLRQARRELASLTPSAAVIGPFRIAA